jgi:hypothetical protein
MATGYFSVNYCFASQNDAIDAFFQNFNPPSYATSTSEIYHIVTYNSGTNPHTYSMLSYYINNQVTPSTLTTKTTIALTTPVFASCTVPNDPATNFANGVELGWAVSGAMVVAYVIYRLRRGF